MGRRFTIPISAKGGVESIKQAWNKATDLARELFDKKSQSPKPAEAIVVVCRGCHKSFMPPLRLPVMICPWCGIPNF